MMDHQQIEDLARGAFEEAMAFGVNFDVFHRMAKAVAERQRESCAAFVEAGKIKPTRDEGTVVVDWDSSEEAAAAIRVGSSARETTKRDDTGVHVTHCCSKCGCRYGDEDCPVATGKLKQAYDCEDCESDRTHLIEQLRELPPEELAALMAEVTGK